MAASTGETGSMPDLVCMEAKTVNYDKSPFEINRPFMVGQPIFILRSNGSYSNATIRSRYNGGTFQSMTLASDEIAGQFEEDGKIKFKPFPEPPYILRVDEYAFAEMEKLDASVRADFIRGLCNAEE